MKLRYTLTDGRYNETVTGPVDCHQVHVQLDDTDPITGRELKVVLRENGDVEITGFGGIGDPDRDVAVIPSAVSNQFRVRFVDRPPPVQPDKEGR